MARTRRSRFVVESIQPLVRLWVLRILVDLDGVQGLLRSSASPHEPLVAGLGLEPWIDGKDSNLASKGLLKQLQRQREEAESDRRSTTLPPLLQANLDRLTALMGLSATERWILAITILVHSEPALRDAFNFVDVTSTRKAIQALSVVLALPESEVRQALHGDGALLRSGLVLLDRSGCSSMEAKLSLLSDSLPDRLTTSDTDPIHLLKGTIDPVAPGHLGLTDYAHIQHDLDILLPYLRSAMAKGQRGVNILLHGAPGTGKSQLTRALSADLGCELFEVACADESRYTIDSAQRLRAFNAGQYFFGERRALIAFDEVEDVFSDATSFFGRISAAQAHKASLNRTLEGNQIPAFWLTNSMAGIDPAFIRRFDMIVELPVPPRSQRQSIVQQVCGDLVGPSFVQQLAEVETLAPAVVSRAATVVRAIGGQLDDAQRERHLKRLIGNTLEAQGHPGLRLHNPHGLPESYDPTFTHADTDLAQVAAGLKHARTGRLCLFGPPGTGKTAYGRWLAQQLNAPLVVRRTSDLLSMWVGGSEKNIARAFREAEQAHAVLLIDEVDSFLQDRRGASHSWEVTGVNEMLTQMESYAGILVASTNLMSGLDPAALRRFDLKVKFDFLKPEQALGLFRGYCSVLGFSGHCPTSDRLMQQLRNVTPGDFAAVMRQHRFRPFSSPADLAASVQAECALKSGTTTPMGFLD